MRKLIVIVVLILSCVRAFAVDPFSLKGKVVIIPPCYKNNHTTAEDLKVHLFYSWRGGFNNVYSESSLKHYSFDRKNRVKEDLYGKELYLEDVVFLDKKNEKRAVLLVVVSENKKYVLHFPLFKVTENGKEELYDYDGFVGNVEDESYSKGRFVWTLYSPHSLDLLVYEKDKLNDFDIEYKDQNLFINRAVKKVKGKPWHYAGVNFLWENYKGFGFKDEQCFGWNNNPHQMPVCVRLMNGDDNLYVAVDSIGDLFVEEKTFLDTCEARYHDSYVDEFASNYVNQNIHIESDKDNASSYVGSYVLDSRRGAISEAITKGNFYCERIGLYYTNRRDSVYYTYHAILHKIGDKGVDEQDIFCPINDFKRVNVELFSKYQERVRQKELAKAKKYQDRIEQAQKEEQEYYQMLVRKYGKANAKLIKEGEVRIGFTKEMCIEAWGEPEYINTLTNADGRFEQWVYGLFSYLYFKGNKLITIQDQE